MAYSIVSVYGMNEKIGNVSFYDSKADGYKMTKPYSETTAETIDDEVRKLIASAYDRTLTLLTSKKGELETLAKELLEKEILFQADLEKLIGKRPFEKETTYQAFTNKKETDSEVDKDKSDDSQEVETEVQDKSDVIPESKSDK
jgi:cell division protease FtsH